MLMFWYLRRADDAYTGNERKGKEKKPFDWLLPNGCAHDRSARFALQGVRRSRPRWELFGLISLGQIVGFPHVWGKQKVIKLSVLRLINPLTKRTFT